MDIYEIRRRKLERIIEEDFGGSRAELTRRLKKEQNALGRYFIEGEHARNIGAPMAREVEKAAGRPEGWMDIEPIDPELLASVLEGVDEILNSLDYELDYQTRAKLYIMAYEDSSAKGKLQLKQAKAMVLSLPHRKR